MVALNWIDVVAGTLAVLGLTVVIFEIAVKSPRSFLDMITDSRGFARQPAPRPALRAVPTSAAASRPVPAGTWMPERSQAA